MFHHIVSTESSKLLKIDNIGFSGDPANNRFGPGERNLYLIHYVFSGKGYFNGSPVVPMQGFLIRPHTHECYYPDAADPWSFLWVTSRDPAMEELFGRFGAAAQTRIFNYRNLASVISTAKLIAQNHNRNYSAPKILEIFLNLFNSETKPDNRYAAKSDMYFEYARNYIAANLYRPVRVAELVDTLGITQPYLYRIFREKCNRSPKQYIDQTKIEAAKELLTGTYASIADIGNSIGFEDPFAFSRFFKKMVGQSPNRFRQQQQRSHL